MIYTELTKLAMSIAEKAHRGQIDKGGYPYIHHPLHVAESMLDQYSCAAALLHDVVEDTPIGFDNLLEWGIPETVIEALRLLTHDDDTPYMDYVKRIGNNIIARNVKLADLEHNLDSTRLPKGSSPRKKAIYLEAKEYLLSLKTPFEEIVLATSNKGKQKEYEDLLAPLKCRILLPEDLGLDIDVEENGSTYRENAIIKANYLSGKTSLPVIADDSGIEVFAMGDRPGLHTARYAKENGGFPDVWYKVIEEIEGKDRGARFVCNIALKEKENEAKVFEGICPGRILEKPLGHNGFGYDPIFHSDEGDIDFGTAKEEEKAKYSHRGKASQKLIEYILNERKKRAKSQ
ncbi:MAG: RdgB/HAM1 family non-canonical purine NTP pyrophosphatase [Bacilli bacterium]|nr:RdgB/HAM1 family non-canonical purine NTP pyrophosphatase [Bacilli bacterium]